MQYASYRILFQQRRICVFVLPDLKRSLRNLEALDWHCQTNLSGPARGAGLRRSGRQLTPLGQGGRTVLFEDVAAVEVTVVVEVIVCLLYTSDAADDLLCV